MKELKPSASCKPKAPILENLNKGTAAKPLTSVVEGKEVMDRVTKQTRRVMIAPDEMSRQMVVQTDRGGGPVRKRADVRVMPMSDISNSISKAHQRVSRTQGGLYFGGCPSDHGGTAYKEGPIYELLVYMKLTDIIIML